MSWEEETVAAALQQAVQLVASQKGEQLAQAITPILMANLDSGRVYYFLDKRGTCQPEDYVWRALAFYEKWHTYLYQIQEERRADLWLPLYEKLKRWAYNYLSSKNFPPTPKARLLLAADCATMAAARLLYARFPYDTDFDPWAYVLLQNVVLKQLRKEYREAAANLHNVDNWEEWESVWSSQLSVQDPGDNIELRQTLLAAVDQLASDARKQIILWRYFEGLTFPQIAAEMDRSANAIYKLHFDALKNLRKILESSGDKYE